MPINSAFKRSLLNSQPIVKKIDGIISTQYNPDDGYAGVNCGFAEIIERQDGIEVERAGDELSDTVTIDKTKEYDGLYNISRKKPEIVLTLQPQVETSQQERKYRDFVASIEEYDQFQFFNSLTSLDDSNIRGDLTKRLVTINEEVRYLQASLDSMSTLVDSRKELFRSISLTKNKARLNKIASSFRKNYYNEYSEDPQGNIIDLSSTLLGFENFNTVKNSSIVYSLAMAAALPGTILFQKGTSAGSNAYTKFDALKIKRDTVSDFLQLLARAKYITSTDFFNVESYIPTSNKVDAMILLSEALAYELTTTKGLSSINTSNENIFSFLNAELGLVYQIANENSTGNLFSIFKNEKFYELEPDDELNGSLRVKGFVAPLIDEKINNASFDFTELESLSKKNSDKIIKYADFIKKIRLLEDKENFFSAQNLITRICDAIIKSLGNWTDRESLTISDAQFALLCKLSKDNTNYGKRLRQIVFKEIFNVDTLDNEEYDTSGFRNNILNPIYVTEEPNLEETSQTETGLGTSSTIKHLFRLKDDVANETATPKNLFKFSYYPETSNRIANSSFEYAKNFNSVTFGKDSKKINFQNDAYDTKVNFSNLNCSSMFEDSLRAFNDINNQTTHAAPDSNDSYAANDSYVDVSNLINKFTRIILVSMGSSSVEDELDMNVLLRNICSDFTGNDSRKLSYSFDMNDEVISNILKDNETFSTLRKEILIVCDEIYQNLGLRPGQKTRTFKLSTTKIKFLIFEILLSILSLFNSTTIKKRIDAASKFIAVIDRTEFVRELNELKQIARRKGSESYISEGLVTQIKKITVAIGACSNSSDLVASRVSQLYAIAQNYIDSFGDFLKITSQKDLLNKINNISKEKNAFSNLTPELASAKKIAYMNVVSSPLSIKNTTRFEKTYSYFSEILESELRNLETSIVAVGLPLSTIHYLRNNNNYSKEYIEINLSKRNTVKSEALINDTTIRFSQFLEVIPQFTKSQNLMSIIHDFKYLCYENGDWKPKSIENTINFISRVTGLNNKNSSIILINHAFDALAKCHIYNRTGIALNDLLYRNEFFAISNEGKAYFDAIDSRINLNIKGEMTFNDFVEPVYNGYRIKKYSELGKTLIDKTDQPTHRLLNSVMSDSLFSVETLKNCLFSTQPFERIYCVPVSRLDLTDFKDAYVEFDTNSDINEIGATIKLVSS